MRIAYVTVDPGIPVFGTKGASVHIQEVVRELIRRGHDVTVHTTRAGRDIPDDLAGLKVIETRIEADDPAARERAQQEVSARIAARIIADGADLVYERYSLFSTALAEVTDATGAVGVLEVNAPLIEEQRSHRHHRGLRSCPRLGAGTHRLGERPHRSQRRQHHPHRAAARGDWRPGGDLRRHPQTVARCR